MRVEHEVNDVLCREEETSGLVEPFARVELTPDVFKLFYIIKRLHPGRNYKYLFTHEVK